ncbi:uncharacterized protein HaLaN_03899 [Haematococcus lacustris]|uniref:MFS domain-containing protein n=1 Tax=Haematococcus lacustris TaxID=44745 RepID=A0A699YQ41_HAELA|nr:uncharacterized protein HaLaN_03899 [Haematococcus lacustris]
MPDAAPPNHADLQCTASASMFHQEGGAGNTVQHYLDSIAGHMFLFNDVLHLSPAEAGLAQAIGLIPWNCTPLLGVLTDNVAILGSHRKAYLLLVGLLGASTLSLTFWRQPAASSTPPANSAMHLPPAPSSLGWMASTQHLPRQPKAAKVSAKAK